MNYDQQILKFMARRDYSPVKLSEMVTSLGVADRDIADFKNSFEALRQNGRVISGARGIVSLPSMPKRVTGTFRENVKGFGFIRPDEPNADGDLFVSPDDKASAMTGDTVVARAIKKGIRYGQMRYNGEIVEILERGQKSVIGTLRKPAAEWIVVPDGKDTIAPVAVDDVTAKGAKVNDKVKVDIISYPDRNKPARGVITEVFGKAGQYEAEIESIIAQYDLPGQFVEECFAQARNAADTFSHASDTSRDDITGDVIITIDPDDAKDFDDAISLRKNPDGNWVLGVHIADVSTFIEMDSPLDKEAKIRGNSTYLPGRVIPMLPEILSNGICSLQPDQDRFAKSVYITYDETGHVLGREFANSLIRSSARLSYKQADDILHGKAADFPGDVVALLKDMETLARVIEKRRIKNGMLHLDLPETELIYDENGQVVDAEPADDCYPHTIIEMFMVEANEAVAALIDRFNVPFIRRIHPEPDSIKTKNLGRFAKLCGLKVPRNLDRAAIQDLLASAKGTSSSYAINMHILRSLQRAEYAPLHIGHFALASKYYCHFTSPIRRYADLMIHRLLQCYLEGRLNMIGLEEILPETELVEIGNQITLAEERSTNAERELKTVLILQMLSKRIGSTLECVVSGLTNFGVFVQCRKFGVEGMIELANLGLDTWKYDQHRQAIIGAHSGKSVHLGQDMPVKIVTVNVPGRQLDVVPVELLVSTRKKVKGFSSRRNTHKKRNHRKKRR